MSAQDKSGVPTTADMTALRAYWLTGPGAARIKWGMPGDLSRCHREVSQETRDDPSFTSNDIWGFCQNLHKSKYGVPNPRD